MPSHCPKPWLLTCLLFAAVGCSSQEAKPRPDPDRRLPRLETVQPTRTPVLPVQIELAATVEPFEKADLCARLPGVVEGFSPSDLDIGHRVQAGQELVRLAVPDLRADLKNKEALLDQARKQKQQAVQAQVVAAKEVEEAREQEKRYQAENTFRKDQHQRTQQLVERAALQPERAQETLSQLHAAEAAWRAAKAQIGTKQARTQAAAADLEVAESRIRVAEAEVERLTTLVGYATIRAPFDGVLTKRWVDRGSMVKDAGAPLLTLMHTDTVRIVLDIPERHVPLVNTTGLHAEDEEPRATVLLRIASLREVVPGGEFRGCISRIASALDPATRTMRAEVLLPNEPGHLRPGMYGTAAVLLDERFDVLTVPATALVRRGGKTEVFYVADVTGEPPRGVVRRTEVELGMDDGRRVEIRKGLAGTEHVIAKGNGVVREGDIVLVVPGRMP